VFAVPAPANHANDGRHTLLLRSTDLVGNVETAQKFMIAIDTRRPRSRAPWGAIVRRGAYATLRFNLLDARPSSGECQAVIVVKSLGGTRKLKLTLRPWYKSGRLSSYRFRCKLPRGLYRFFVTAWDGAGNRSAKAAWNYLTVF
jgi:hypothetical protein